MRQLAFAALACLSLSLPALAQEDGDPREDFRISDDLSALPLPVAQMREQLLAAARSGDIEALRPIMQAQQNPPTVSFGEPEDAVAYLKETSSDKQGFESLAILADLLAAPYGVAKYEGQDPVYIWPYLAGMWDITQLTPAQTVDALRIVSFETLGELQDLEAWYYWRVVIGSDGEWQAFVAGD